MTATKTRPVPAKIRRGPTAGRHVRVDTKMLRMTMKLSGMTSGQVARRAGLSDGAVRNLTSGGRDTCKPETAAALVKALGLKKSDVRDIFELVKTDEEW